MVLDALAEDEEGRLINVEMYPQEDEDHVRRVRYHLSGIDMSYLEKGNDFEAIPEVYLIYITKKDFIGRNKGINEIIRIVDETGTFPHLTARVRLLKEKKEGIDIMCDILEKERAEGKAEGIAEGIAAFILDNLEEHKTEEQILAKLVTRFSLSREEAGKYLDEYIPKD